MLLPVLRLCYAIAACAVIVPRVLSLCVLQAIALLRRHRATEELDLTGLSCGSPDGQEGGEAPVECIRGLVRHVAPQLTK